MSVPPGVLAYVLDGVSGTPMILGSLLAGLKPGDPRWDARPDADRFTLREMVAHVADWDEVVMQRLQRILTEENPLLENMDESRLAIERDYARQDPIDNLGRLKRSRPGLVAAFRAARSEDWSRPAHRENVGDIDLFKLAVMLLGHDAYHLEQAARFSGN